VGRVGGQVWDQVRSQIVSQIGSQVWDQIVSQVKNQVLNQVRHQVSNQVWNQVESQIENQVLNQIWNQIENQVWNQVWNQVGSQVENQVRNQVKNQVRNQEIEYISFSSYGNISDYNWISFYDFFTQIGVINHSGFKEFKNILLSGIYDMIQLEGFCIVSALPTKIIRNNSGRLHNTKGAAIEFADGYKQYYINGKSMPEWIFDQEITKDMFLKEKNSEIKGGFYEILGQVAMMKLLGAEEVDVQQIVHKNGDIETVTLLKTKEKFTEIDNQPFAWVKMICPSTETQYLQGVEPHFTNAIDAIASLSRFKPQEYSFDYRS
jgi:6-pyruvoyl-tetrahydropterin synthase